MGYEIPEAMKAARGRAIVNLLQLEPGEHPSAIIPLNETTVQTELGDEDGVTETTETTVTDENGEETVVSENGYIVLATKRGLIKKTAVSEFDNIRKTGKIAINLNDGDELISVQVSTGNDEILVASHEGKCIRFSETDVRAMGRDTMGVKAMQISEDDSVVDMTVVKDGYDVLTLSEHGFGKRSDIEDYRLQSRGGKGIKAGVFNEKTGNLACLKLVKEDEDIMIIADNGIIIRTAATGISKIGRDTKGVTVMKLGDSIVKSVAVVPHSEEQPEDEEGAENTENAENVEGAEVQPTETIETSENAVEENNENEE